MTDTDRAVGIQDPSLAIGLSNINFFSSNIPFINVIKQVGGLVGDDGAWLFDIPDGNGGFTRLDYSELFHNGFLDENGYVTTIPEGGITRISLFNDLPAEAGIGGRYVFTFEGEGDFTLFGGTIVESEPGRIVIDIADGSSVGVTILDVEEGNHLREFALVREEHEALYEAGAIFNPDFIEAIEDFRVLRFLDWQGTTNSNVREFSDYASVDTAFYGIPGNQALETEIAGNLPDFIDQAELATLPRGFVTPVYVDPITREPLRDEDTNELIIYPPDTGDFPAGIPVGAPPEVLLALSNQVGADPWFNIPHLATDEFVREFAEFIRDNLDPELNVYIEYSNEVWNPQFDQWHFAREQGLDFFEERRQLGDNFGDQFGDFPTNAYNGIRTVQILSIFDEVFGADSERVVGVLGGQQVNNFVALEAITAAEYYLELTDPGARLDDLIDSVAITGYFGENVTTEGPVADSLRNLIDRSREAFENGLTADEFELFNVELAQFYRDGTLFEGADPVLAQLDALSLTSLVDAIVSHQSIIDGNDFFGNPTRTAYDFDLIQYEGGPNIVPVTNDPDLQSFLRQFNRSDEVGQLQTEAFEIFRNGGGTLANDFHFVEVQSFSSTFGTIANLQDSNGLSDNVLDFNENAAQTFGTLDSDRVGAFVQGITDTGTTSSDTIFGTREEDFIAGGLGNDSIDGGAGNNGLNGEEGNDVLSTGEGNDTIVGGAGNDSIVSGGGSDSLTGGDDNDTILAGAGEDSVDGGSGDDSIISQTGNDLIYGGAGSDFISSSDGSDTIIGGDGRDTIQSGIGSDSITGGQGSDSITGSLGLDTIEGGLGDDTINGNQGADSLSGGIGNDSIISHAGADFIDGGDGADFLNGLSNNDTILGGDGSDTIFGDSGSDQISGGTGDDEIDSGTGDDNVTGGAGNDNINGSFGADNLIAGSGFDTILGGVDDDTIDGGSNADNLFGEEGDDQVIGGAGNDFVSGGSGNDNLDAGTGNDLLSGGSGFDTIFGAEGDDRIFGGSNSDFLNGDSGNDTISGGGGSDRILGQSGNDSVAGNDGNDLIFGGSGFDIINGGSGDDRLSGGGNADVFVFEDNFGNDIIDDFNTQNSFEFIDLSGVTNITSFADLLASHLSSNSNGDTVISDGTNTITLVGVAIGDLGASDFIF